jgi:hypothetical protein
VVLSGREQNKAAAIAAVEKAIDQALAPKKVRPVQSQVPRRSRKVSERSRAIPTTKEEKVSAPTVLDYRGAHLVRVTSQNGPFDVKWYAVGFSRIRYAEAAVCALPEIKPTDVVAALRKLTLVEIAAIGVGHRKIVLCTMEKTLKPSDSMLTIDAAIHDAVMTPPAEARRNRARVNQAVREGLTAGPLRPAGSEDLYGVPKATK